MQFHDAQHATTATATPAETWRAARESATVRWWQTTTFVHLHGPDALTFMDGLCTWAVTEMAVGEGRHSLLLDAKARIIVPVFLYRAPDADWSADAPAAPRLLLELDPALVDATVTHLRRFRLRSKVTVEPLAAGTIAVVGPASAELVACAGDSWYDVPWWGVPARTFIGDVAEAGRLVREELPSRGVMPADPDALDALRIDEGVPGLDEFVVGRMPAEVGAMPWAVSLDKGCYLGQEPVARLHYRGRSNRRLGRVELAGDLDDATFATGDGAREVRLASDPPGARSHGMLTSWAQRPDGTWTGFAMVRHELEPGVALLIGPGGADAVDATLGDPLDEPTLATSDDDAPVAR